jgi:hypothetical protein
VFGVQATASLSAGAVLELANWEAINAIGILLILTLFSLLLRGRRAILHLQPS